MGAKGKRLRKLEQECKRHSIKHLLLVERYLVQPIEEAKAEAGLTILKEFRESKEIVFMSAQDAATL